MNKYRLRLMAKGQMTVPAAMRDELGMKLGDELEIAVEGGKLVGAQVLTPVPAELFTPELIRELEARAKQLDAKGSDQMSTVEELRERVEHQIKREAHARKAHSPIR